MHYPDLTQKLKVYVKATYKDYWKDFFIQNMKKVDYLEGQDDILEELYYFSKMDKVNEGEFIVRDSEPCKFIYLIGKGKVEMQILDKQKGDAHILDALYKGSIIGMYNVIMEEAFLYSAKSVDTCIIFKVEKTILESKYF